MHLEPRLHEEMVQAEKPGPRQALRCLMLEKQMPVCQRTTPHPDAL